MFPLKTIGTGVLLLMLSAVGIGYVIVRPKPKKESLPTEPLLAEEAPPSPEVTKTPDPTPDDTDETKAATEPRTLNSSPPRTVMR